LKSGSSIVTSREIYVILLVWENLASEKALTLVLSFAYFETTPTMSEASSKR
jgi:hypothetical protein